MRHDIGLRSIRRQYPRGLSALLFGGSALAVIYFAWIPDARTSGLTPAVTIAGGAVHALAAALTGRRLLDDRRTRSIAEAGLVGALTSLLAQAIFSPLFAMFLFATDAVQPSGWITYLLMPAFIAAFAFLAIGWALMLVSSAIACALYRITSK
jgi:hypothetical protein